MRRPSSLLHSTNSEPGYAVEHDNVAGTQFHPEKSGPAGLRVYANFAARCAAPVRA